MTDVSTIGTTYLNALQHGDFQQIEACFHPRVAFRALVPSDVHEETDAGGVIAHLRDWFGQAESLTVIHQTIDASLGRLYLAYRIRLHKSDEWQVVEQHAYCSVRDGRIERMDLLCSGFLPAHEPGAAHGWHDHMTGEGGAPMATDKHLPRPDSVLDAPGQGCATLTPLIRARIRDLESGRILEVRTDDPSALDSLQAWSRLTGNELVAVVDDGAEIRRFFIRRK